MSIYQKIATMQQELLKEKFPTTRGYRGEYIPLQVMLPPVLKQCTANELTLYFTSTNEHLMLKLMSWDGKEEFSVRVRLPELTSDEKKEGARITYLKRYLLMNTFMILEDSIDADDLPDENASSAEVTFKEVKSDIDVPSLIKEAKEKLQKKGVEPTNKAIKNQVRTLKTYSVADRRAINEYFKREGL